MTATTDSGVNRLTFPGFDFSPSADFLLLKNAYETAEKKGIAVKVGNVLTADVFYRDNLDPVRKLGEYGVLAVEMETNALYTLAAKYGVQALSVLTVSDHIFTGESTTAKERETTFHEMIDIALGAVTE